MCRFRQTVDTKSTFKMESTTSFSGYPIMQWATAIDIPLKASEEVVSIDLETDLPDDPSDLRTLLVEESSDKEHWLTIAIAYCNQGRIPEGIKLIEMALETFENVEKAPLHTFLTWAHLKLAKENSTSADTKNYELNQAELHLTDAIGFDPTWVGNMLATIDLYYQRNQYDKALETAELFMKGIAAEDRRNGRTTKPNCFFILLRAKILYQKKNYVASLRLFQELLVLNPVLQPDPRLGIGMCFWQLKDHKMAINSWKRAKEINPRNKNASILVLLGEFHNSLTESENDTQFKEKYESALKNLESLYSQDKENPVLLTLLQSYFFFKGDYQKVIEVYEEKILKISSITASTILSDAAFWCGRAQYALTDYRKAFAMFQESLRKNEDKLLSKFGLGQTQIKNNLLEEGILTFENLYKNFESIQELNYILGLLYAGKCLDSTKKLSFNESQKLSAKAIQYLEKYINLTTSKNNLLVIPRAYLVLSQLYEIQNQYKTALEYLSKCLEDATSLDKNSVPLEIYNNIGCFHFINGDHMKAMEFFELAKSKMNEAGESQGSIDITLQYNIARSSEPLDMDKSSLIYDSILSKHPEHIHLKIRSLFTKFIQNKGTDLSNIEMDVNILLKDNQSDLEVRSFFSWFMKNSLREAENFDEKKLRENQDLEISNNKETLTKYDSHDAYALISLGNFYCILAKESKKNPEKAKQSYLKGVQLFQKALQLDPFNVFAAQGLAVVFAESKRFGPALEILRKVRDSLDTEDVHLNLANCLLEMHEYAKAIEGYEFALKRFEHSKKRSKIHNLLGRTWHSRGNKEKSLQCYKKALSNAEEALVLEVDNSRHVNKSTKVASYKFNVALLHFQIAETLRRSNVKDITRNDIVKASEGLEVGIKMLKDLKDNDFKFIAKDELEQRIQLGETTMKSALERCLREQEQFTTDQLEKLEQARKILEENELKEKERIEIANEIERAKLEKQREEFKKLQEEAQKLIQERESAIVYNSSDEEGKNYENDEEKEDKRAKRKKSSTSEKKTKKRKTNTDSELRDEDEDEDEDEGSVTRVSKSSRRGKKPVLSAEFIESSDEDDIDFDAENGQADEEEAKATDGSDNEAEGLF